MRSEDILIDRPERVFQAWGYSVSMGRLLLRSNRTEQFSTRVQVLFQDVSAMSITTKIDGLKVSFAGRRLTRQISRATGIVPSKHWTFYKVEHSGRQGFVVAAGAWVEEDEGTYYDNSRLWPLDENGVMYFPP